jgi:hypothetical protein
MTTSLAALHESATGVLRVTLASAVLLLLSGKADIERTSEIVRS